MQQDSPETHPFEAFVPDNIRCLIIGSFPGKDQTAPPIAEDAWFYGAPKNQFWKIMRIVYELPLSTKTEKQALFREAGIGITDIIHSCTRKHGTNLDENLEICTYNNEVIQDILQQFRPTVLFTSRFVEKLFRKFFPDYAPTALLPSPSPRYFRINIEQKAAVYRSLLPQLSSDKNRSRMVQTK